MEISTKLIVFFTILLFFLHSSSISAQVEVDDEKEFDYKDGSEKGPKQWGKLKPEWAACSNGGLQSPIDLSHKRVKIIPNLGDLKISYNPSDATLKNRGHDIAVFWAGNPGSIEIEGVTYHLQQSHWHSPSEHSIDGIKYDLELHMVHVSSDNKIAVLGQLYTIGHPERFLAKLSTDLHEMVGEVEEKKMGVMNPADIKFGGKKYYRYVGSLTVPPCTEGVIWTINKKIGTVSREQVDLLRVSVHDLSEFNARPSQPLNDREIHMYNPARTAA